MPSMFSSSRRRGSSTSRTRSMDQSTSTAATLAARSAAGGLYRPPSSGSLSSAAAAAALRSATTTPEPVGSIQTKRMVRRGSQSSIGSSVAGPVRGGLQRQNSSGSMTDRTFRSPSPGSSNGNGYSNGAMSPDPYAPPVPAMPKNIPSGHKRSSSMDPPQRVMSPNRAPRGARGVSADRASSMVSGSARKPPRLSDVAEELERSDSNRNMNFSRPRAFSPMGSPTVEKKFTHGTGAWHSEPVTTKTSTQGTSASAMDQKIARIQNAAGRNSSVRSSSQPAHLTKANLDAVSAAADDYETVMVFDANSRTFVPEKRLKPTRRNEPASPVIPKAAPLKPGQYDPSTRTIVPHPTPVAQPVRSQRPVPAALDTSLVPPPRNPARLSPTTSPTSARHPLVKHPSTVQERPDEEDELASSRDSSYTDTGKIIQTTAGPAKAYAATPTTKPRSSSLDVPRGAMNGSFRGRNISASPSPQRARFSASPVVQATMHVPLARDVSPAKSAMKHSPAPSVRAVSPLAHFSNPKSPSSETSETPSLASHDGLAKKKKSVRVSFDEQPQVTSLSSPTSPKALDDLDDEDDLMKPRPALPSFGSVRKSRNPDYAEKVTEMAPERNVSNDHAIGGILANANGSAKPASEPVAPVVTSKETTGEDSDSDYSVDEQGAPSANSAVKPDDAGVVSRDFASAEPTTVQPDGDVPDIKLMPPTPGVEQEAWDTSVEGEASPRARLSKEVVLPGGWNEIENEAEGETHTDEPQLGGIASPPNLQAINEFDDSDDDDNANFSDAAEDLSDMEGGFASLDAIAVSPVVPATQAPKPASPVSPSVQKASKRVENEETREETPSGDWSQATAYWSTLSRQQREQIEREHFSSDDEARPAPAVKKTKKKTAPKQNAELSPNTAATVQKSMPAQSSTQPAKPALKKSMRAPPGPAPAENQVHMRSSMRAGGGSGMASTLRDGSRQQSTERPGSMQKKTMRPASNQLSNSAASTAGATTLPRQNSQSSVMSQPKSQARASNQPTAPMSARLQKELRKADDSDSDSSFKKQRRSARTHSGFAMKSSMRGGPEPVEQVSQRPVSPTPPKAKGRDSFSIRSLSPTGSLFGRKKMNRDPSARSASVDPGVKTLRGAQPQRSSLRTPAAAPPKTTTSSFNTSRFKSRFADSDDEDDGPAPAASRGGRFSSRFADSDDEDDVFSPVKLAPVRGIPRRQGQTDGDSTDLSDEDEQTTSRQREKFNTPMVPNSADIDKAMEAARKKLGITESPAQNGNEGGALAQGSLRDSTQDTRPEPFTTSAADTTPKKRGFMGSILRRNRASTASVPGYRPSESMPASPTVPTSAAAAPEYDVGGSPTGPAKLARRSSYQQAPRMKRGDSTYSNATAPPAMGESDISNWPLPPMPSIPDGWNEKDRPSTTEGTGVRFAEGPQVYSARTGKKKKFSMLRRAFGLHD